MTQLKIRVKMYSNRGGRENNEDCVQSFDWENGGICILADGLGGHKDGEVASASAAEGVIQSIKQKGTGTGMQEILKDANQAVRMAQGRKPGGSSMRTTIVLCRYNLEAGILEYGNIGDSRFYFFKRGQLSVQSKDHSMSQLAVDMGEIKKDQIRFHEERNRLTKVLGEPEELSMNAACFGEMALEDGDAFLLCSDGFWEYVFETEMELDLLKSQDPEEWISNMVARLYGRVPERHDNFSVICGIVRDKE